MNGMKNIFLEGYLLDYLNIEYNIEVKITGKGNINNYIKGE